MKILLINPFISGNDPAQLEMREPLGLAYLASFLKSRNYDVSIADCFALGKGKITKNGPRFRRGLSDDEIVAILEGFNPDIVGITCNFTVYSQDAYHIAKLLKNKYKDVLVVLGGAHASTLTAEDLSGMEYIDVVVRGEGEVTLYEIAQRYEQGKDISTVEGTIVRRGKDIIVNQFREPISNLDALPLPSRELLDMKFYLENSDIYGHAKKRPVASIVTSRGCTFNCIFCSVKHARGRIWRGNSPSRVLEEIELLANVYGVREIFIYDDNFFIDLNRVFEICDLIGERKLDVAISISCGTFVKFINFKLLSKLKKAHVYRLSLPVETGNEKTLEFIRKPINLYDIKKKVKLCHRMGFWTAGNFIMGFPYETEQDILKTIHFAESCGFDFVMYFVAQPILGSDLYEIFKKEGLLPNGRIDLSNRPFDAGYNTRYLSAERIQYLRDKAASGYIRKRIIKYISPWEFIFYFLPKIKTTGGLKYFLKLLMNVTFIEFVFGKKKI